MVFGTDPFLNRARILSEADDTVSLRYACLELRFALEHVAYQKLQLRLGKVTLEEIDAWQPQRVMDRVMELADEHLAGDSVVKVAFDKGADMSRDDAFTTVGTTKGITPRDIGKHWQKLGSFLHAQMPKKKGDRPKEPEPDALRAYIRQVIAYIEQITSTRFDAHFSIVATFRCGKCNQSIVRNANLVKPGDLVLCQNPNCTAAYTAHKEHEQLRLAPYEFHYSCTSCKRRNNVTPNPLLKLKTHEACITSCACGTEYKIYWTLHVEPHQPAPKLESSEKS